MRVVGSAFCASRAQGGKLRQARYILAAVKVHIRLVLVSMSGITPDEFEQLARDEVPIVGELGLRVELLEEGRVRIRLPYRDHFLRPGGTIAGPVMMGLADVAMWALVLSMVGPVHLAVTTNLNINFLRRPPPSDIIAEGRILKLGKRLAVGEVTIFADGEEDPVAHVTSTYSIPPQGDPKAEE